MKEQALWDLLRLVDMRAEAPIQERWQANAHCTFLVQQDIVESISCVTIYMQCPQMIYKLWRSQQQEPEYLLMASFASAGEATKGCSLMWYALLRFYGQSACKSGSTRCSISDGATVAY